MSECGQELVLSRKADKILAIGVFTLLIMMISEIYMFYAPTWLLFLICYAYGGRYNDSNKKTIKALF